MNHIHRYCLSNIDNLIHQSANPRHVYNLNTPYYFLDVSINTDFIITYKGIKEVQFIDPNNFQIKLKTRHSTVTTPLYTYHRFFKTHLEAVIYFEQLRTFCLKQLQSRSEYLKQAALSLMLIKP